MLHNVYIVHNLKTYNKQYMRDIISMQCVYIQYMHTFIIYIIEYENLHNVL